MSWMNQIFHHWSRVATDSTSWDYPVCTRDTLRDSTLLLRYIYLLKSRYPTWGSTRLHPFTILLHHSHWLRHAQNYGQVGVRHCLAEAEPLNGFRLRWWHSDNGGGKEHMRRDDYQVRRTKCTSWTEYKPGKNKGHGNHPALITTANSRCTREHTRGKQKVFSRNILD